MNRNYKLRYLPIFYKYLDEKLTYIIENLNTQETAINLLDKVEEAIINRLPVAESFEPYHSIKERKYKYYRIYVDNFTVYYVVIKDNPEAPIMEVRRFIYNGQNRDELI